MFQALVDHYDKLAYDPIEGRTQSNSSIKPNLKTRYIPNRKGQSKYKEMLEAIFTDNKSHNFTTIKKMLEDLTENQ